MAPEVLRSLVRLEADGALELGAAAAALVLDVAL